MENEGGYWGASHPPSLGPFKLEIKKGNKTITEAILSLIFSNLVKSGQPPAFKNPGSATAFGVRKRELGQSQKY